MAFPILGTPKPQFFGNDKDFLSGGLLYTYDPATDLPKATYPTADDADAATNANTNPIILNSRGEPPLMLGISVFYAIRDAIATEQKSAPELHAPATPEAVLKAIEAGQA